MISTESGDDVEAKSLWNVSPLTMRENSDLPSGFKIPLTNNLNYYKITLKPWLWLSVHDIFQQREKQEGPFTSLMCFAIYT